MAAHEITAAIDHVVVLMFENRSFDNLLGRLYEPGEVSSFEGVLGKECRTRFRRGPSMVRTQGGRLRRRRGHEHAGPGPG